MGPGSRGDRRGKMCRRKIEQCQLGRLEPGEVCTLSLHAAEQNPRQLYDIFSANIDVLPRAGRFFVHVHVR